MAGKPRFRVPTVEEMEKADRQEEYTTSRALFRREGSSRPVDNASEAKSDSPPKAKNTPRKRMMSQKALLSRMPLSRQTPLGQSKISASSTGPDSSEKVESATVSKGLNSERDPAAYGQVSHSIADNVSQSKPKGPPTAVNTGQASVSKSITSSWTGNTLGDGRRHAQQPPHHLPAASVATGPQKETVTNRDGSSASLEQTESASSASAGTSAGDSDQQQQHAVRADVLPTLAKLGKTNSLVVNSRQRGNPILKFVRNVPWEFGNIVPDYVMGQSNCALYLSLRYHQLHPEYIHTRLKQLGHSFDLRVLLVQVDIKDPHHLLKDLAKICILADCTLMVAFSAEEAGRYLETYKVYENKAAEAIMERTDSNFTIQLSDCLTRVKSVNKTDCSTLLATFGDLKGIMGASTEDLSLCPGFGPQKAKRLHDVFREPFLVSKKQRADTASTKK